MFDELFERCSEVREDLYQQVEDYRESAEGLIKTIPELLIWRTRLIRETLDDYQFGMIYGGDEYLKKWIGDLSIRSGSGKDRTYETMWIISGLPEDILKMCEEASAKMEKGDVPSGEFEDMLVSLQELYDFPKDILEATIELDENEVIFDIGY